MISLLTHVRSVHVDEVYPHMGRRQTTKYKIGPVGLAHLDAVNYDDCFLVVPIFGQMKDPSKTRHPAYITAQRHVHTSDSKFNHIFTDEVVLFTPRGALRPVCLGCPRHILHVQGKCEIGGQFCYDSLSLTLEKEEDEQLSSDDSQLDTLSA